MTVPESSMRDIELENNQSSDKEELMPPVDRYYVLIVAVDHYPPASKDALGNVEKEGFKPLSNPVFDANNLLRILQEKYDLNLGPTQGLADLRKQDARYQDYPDPIFLYDGPTCTCLYNEAANLNSVIAKINETHQNIGKNDAFLIYFAGHGFKDLGGGICLYDSDSTSALPGLPYPVLSNKFQNYLSDSKCRDFLLILDCCFSGEITLGNQPAVNAQPFSREVLASCGSDKKACDGVPGQGSPFANAFIKGLRLNQKEQLPLSKLLDPLDLELKLNPLISPEGKELIQKISKGVPQGTISNGQGQFIFPLKKEIAEDVPVHLLANSFIKNLNFDQQKASLNSEFLDVDADDFNIISTCAYNFDVQQFMRTVILRHIKDNLGIDLNLSKPINVWPESVVMNNFWAALAATLAVHDGIFLKELGEAELAARAPEAIRQMEEAQKDLQEKVMENILGQLGRDKDYLQESNNKPMSTPLIITIGYFNNNPQIKGSLIDFCQQFYQLFLSKRKHDEHKNKVFDKLYLVISDIREGEKEMINRDELVTKIGKDVRISVTPPVAQKHIKRGNFAVWRSALIQAAEKDQTPGIPLQKIKSLDPFGQEKTDFEIMELIVEVSEKFKVESMKITQQLGIIPK